MSGPMRVRVYVTDADIRDGKVTEPCECPVALGLRRLFPLADVVSVAVYSASVTQSGETTVLQLPPDCQDFIEEFDNGRPVSPTSFWLTETDHPEGQSWS